MADYNLEGPVWASRTITWSFATSNLSSQGQLGTFSSFFQSGEYETEIGAALARWSAVTNVTFVHVTDSASADIRFGLYNFDGPYNILAETTYYYDGTGHFQPDVLIRFDQGESYHTTADGLELTDGIRFEAVATHEIGHALGLAHYNDGPAIMNAYASASVTDLTQSDIDGIQALYGVRIVATPNLAFTGNDFNADAKTDLLFFNDTTHGVAIWQMNGTQVVANPQIATAAAGWHIAETGDFNGDNKSDLVFLNDTTRGVAIWQMDGTRVVANPQIGTVTSGWHFTDTGDFNGDGKTDLLFSNDTTHGLAVWEMNGTKVIANPQIGTVTGGWQLTGTGDFNGDGKTDLLFANDTTHGLAIWEMNGTKVIANPQIGIVSSGWHFTDTGDFNGDGKTDLLFANDITHGLAIWEMNGTKVIANPQVGTITDEGQFQKVGDFNGDGKSDLLFIDGTTGGITVWQMNGTQVAANQHGPALGVGAGWSLADTGDYNGDGKTDLLIKNDSDHSLAVWNMDGAQIADSANLGTINASAGWHLLT